MQKYQIKGVHSGGAQGPFAVYGTSPEDARRIAETAGITVSAVVLTETEQPPPSDDSVREPTPPVARAVRVARACPACGSSEYRKVPPQKTVGFSRDRECAGCGTQYHPAMPRWKAVLLVLVGFVLGAVALASLFDVVLREFGGQPRVLSLILGAVWTGFVGVLGWIALIKGLRALFLTGKRRCSGPRDAIDS